MAPCSTATPSPIFCMSAARRAANSSFGSSVAKSGGPCDLLRGGNDYDRSREEGRREPAAVSWSNYRLRITRTTPTTPMPRMHTYPDARRLPLVETLHGVAVADPYRWLEDDDSAETRAWVDAQNALTRRRSTGRGGTRSSRACASLYDYPRTPDLHGRGGRYFFTHNPGLLDQRDSLRAGRPRRRAAGAPRSQRAQRRRHDRVDRVSRRRRTGGSSPTRSPTTAAIAR